MTLRRYRSWRYVVLLLATAAALGWSEVAPAQQSDLPTELWEEYPLDPAQTTQEPESGRPQGLDTKSDGSRFSGAEGAAANDGQLPSAPILAVLAVLAVLLLALVGVGVWAFRGRGLELAVSEQVRGRLSGRPAAAAAGFRDRYGGARSRFEPLRERIAAVRRPSLLDLTPLSSGGRSLLLGFSEQGSDPPDTTAQAGGPEEPHRAPPAPGEDPSDPAAVGTTPAKARRLKGRTPTPTKRRTQKPPPPKPPPPAKPPKLVRPAKPPRPAKTPKPERPAKPVRDDRPRPTPKTPASVSRLEDVRLSPEKPYEETEPGPGRLQLVDAATLTGPKLTCSIFGWRDGAVADFYALAVGLQGHEWVVDRSPPFEWPAGDYPPEAREAHASLVEALIEDGWRPVATESAWYRQHFERPVGGGGAERSER